MSESFKRRRKEYLVRLNSLTTKELEVFITEARIDNKLEIINNPKNKEELEIAKAYLSIFKDELLFKNIIDNNLNIIKPDENIFLKQLINIYNDKKLSKKTTSYKKLGKIKAHSLFMQTYKEELDEYLNKNLKNKNFDLLLESESQMLKLLDVSFLNYKDFKNYAKGYHQILIECQNKLS